MCIGFYVMTSAILENFEVDLEAEDVHKKINMAVKGGGERS